MPYCLDFPCCGHEQGDCPTIDSKGRERWRCTECGRQLPLKATSSICQPCQRSMYQRAWYDDPYGD